MRFKLPASMPYRRLFSLIVLVGAVALTHLFSAEAQRPGKQVQTAYKSKQAKGTSGDFDYYSLVMSWSPTHCASLKTDRYDAQCHRKDGRRYAFVLHGLWPQYDRGYPEYCDIGKRPFVPRGVADKMSDIMPSRSLTFHEYKKHGVCTGLDPEGYFALSRKLFESIKIPQRYINPFNVQFVSPSQIEKEFMRENPQLKANMISVSCGGPGDRLRELRICFSKAGELTACGPNENQRKLCRSKKMYVPPVRSTWKGGGKG